MLGNVDLAAYSDAAFTVPMGNCTFNFGTTPDTCKMTVLAGTTVYLKVTNWDPFGGATYTITASGAPIAEGATGVGNPFVLTPGVAHNGVVNLWGSSYYQVTYPTSGTYVITVNGLSADVQPDIYTDAAFMSLANSNCSANAGTIADTCTITVGAGAPIYIRVYGVASANYTITAGTTTIAEGAPGVGNPIVLTPGVPYNGYVNSRGTSYYQVAYPVAGTYTVLVHHMSSNISLNVYSDAAFGTMIGNCWTMTTGRETICKITVAAGSTSYIKVWENAGLNVTYTIKAIASLDAEGAPGIGNPVVLTPGTPYNSFVDSGTSYYQVTYPNAGVYAISLSGAPGGESLFTFSDSGFRTATGTCFITNCTVTTVAANTTVYIYVRSAAAGSVYTITARAAPLVNQGATGLGGPVVLTAGTPYAGTVAPAGVSYYQVTFPAAGTYQIIVSNYSDFIVEATFSNNTFTTATGKCGDPLRSNFDVCLVTVTAGATVYINVASNRSGSSYTITAVTTSIANQGTKTVPIALTPGTATAGMVGSSGISYYKITYANPGTYSVIVKNMTENADPTLYSDAGFTTLTGNCQYNVGRFWDSCTVTTATANTTVYLTIKDASAGLATPGVGVTYTVFPIAHSAVGEGTLASPVVLTPGVSSAGSVVTTANSFYAITYPTAGTYTMTLTNVPNSVILLYYGDPAFVQRDYGGCATNLYSNELFCRITTYDPNITIYMKAWVLSSAVPYTINP